jgi:inorganic pyrophosphatase
LRHPRVSPNDGDPLDVLVLMDAPVFPGCIVPSGLVGVIEAEQTEAGRRSATIVSSLWQPTPPRIDRFTS